jgi:carbon-monoxide dehydrogenase small subunit
MDEDVTVTVTVNGRRYTRRAPARMTAADFVRDVLELTGTHVGCEHGVCGACTILVNGRSVRSCILYAPQLEGAEVLTVEGLTDASGELHPIQAAFRDCHGLQCGFCTPGFLLTTYELLSETRGSSEPEVREALSGNLCRCTGYQGIVAAVQQADRTWQR